MGLLLAVGGLVEEVGDGVGDPAVAAGGVGVDRRRVAAGGGVGWVLAVDPPEIGGGPLLGCATVRGVGVRGASLDLLASTSRAICASRGDGAGRARWVVSAGNVGSSRAFSWMVTVTPSPRPPQSGERSCNNTCTIAGRHQPNTGRTQVVERGVGAGIRLPVWPTSIRRPGRLLARPGHARGVDDAPVWPSPSRPVHPWRCGGR